VAEPLPELDDEPPPVEVAAEVQQEGLDPALGPAVVRVDADRDGGPVPAGGPGVDPERGHEQARVRPEVGRREAERPSARVPRDDGALDLDRPPEQGRGSPDVARGHEPPDLGRRDARDERDDARGEPQPLEQGEVAAPVAAEAERLAGHDELRADRGEVRAHELLRRERGDLRRELDHERLLDPELGEQLQAPLERGEQRDLVAEHLARVRVEGHRGRRRPRRHRRGHHGAVADVHAVERPDRDGARPALELLGATGDVHLPASSASTRSRTGAGTRSAASAGSRASASATVSQRSGSASSTPNGPTAVRRSVTQCPPSAAASERTYVPEPTWSASRTVPSVYATASSACTRERRSGISTAIPRRASR